MKKINYLFLSFLSLSFIACEDDSADGVIDTTNPNITINTPESQMQYATDEIVTIDATITDNIGLETVTVFVTPSGANERELDSFDVQDFLNDNSEYDLEYTLNLEEGADDNGPALGPYAIRVQAIDEQGNEENRTVTINVVAADNVAPTATLNSTIEETYEVGEDLVVNATVTDDEMLDEITLTLRAGTTTWTTRTYNTEHFGDDMTVHNIMETFTIPGNVGAHSLTIEAVDASGNTMDPIVRNFTVNEAPAAGE